MAANQADDYDTGRDQILEDHILRQPAVDEKMPRRAPEGLST
jgi:hypothetical protein